jgi:hypothetical protein
MYLMLMFQPSEDRLRDPDLSGPTKVLWLIGFIVFPFVVALVYIAARGHGIVERRDMELRRAQHVPEQCVAPVTHAGGAASEIASAKKLLDDGTITQQEFESLKARALA